MTSRKQLLVPRINVMKLFGWPVPNYEGFNLNLAMKGVPFKKRVKNFLGTVKRVVNSQFRTGFLPEPLSAA